MGQERERIEQMFSSGDPELEKLARLWCHKMRINYYVIVTPTFDFQGFRTGAQLGIRGGKLIKRVSYSLEKPDQPDLLKGFGELERKVYEIKLDKKWNN